MISILEAETAKGFTQHRRLLRKIVILKPHIFQTIASKLF